MENKLATYLKENSITQAEFAVRIGITQGALSKLCGTGGASPETALAVERETGGAVRATDLKPFNLVAPSGASS